MKPQLVLQQTVWHHGFALLSLSLLLIVQSEADGDG